MKHGLKLSLAVLLAAAVAKSAVMAAEEKPAATPSPFKDDKEKASYGIGVFFGNQIKRSSMDVDLGIMNQAIKDVLDGKEPKLNDEQARTAIMSYQQAARQKLAEKNKKEGETFLAENKNKPGVKTKTVTLQDGTTAELEYKVLSEGNGASPKSNDVVSVNYTGKLLNGKEFDSSSKHGGPLKRPANSLIRGWTEALQMMKVGSKWEIYVPSALAYGDMGNANIEPGSTLVFDMELLGIEAPQAPPTPQPLTSDIIKVPSAEELKKGAKIEVIKPEDAAKAAQEAAEKNKKK